MNKTINDKQCSIVWYVDNMKISHVESPVVNQIIDMIKQEFGKELDVTVCCGKVHNYLGASPV
jgi:hypothetical protein